MKKKALITPLRDEIENLDKIISSIQNQSTPIFIWIIVENDSTDGSVEFLNKLSDIENVENFVVLNLKMSDAAYGLGVKYASVVRRGFDFLEENYDLEKIDFIGILDGDINIEDAYYEKLLQAFDDDSKLGITSGVIYDQLGKPDLADKNWARGGCRLWRRECYLDTDYKIEPAEDTISACRAVLKGWEVYSTLDARAFSRQVSTRVSYSYYGKSAYFRGHTFNYVLLRALKLGLKLKLRNAYQFIDGYLSSHRKKDARITDTEVRNYFKRYLYHKYIKR